MPKLDRCIDRALPKIPGIDVAQVRKAQRVRKVRDMWASLVEPVFLEHTNNVFVFRKDGELQMHVYVDESIYAAELNNRRELIRWRCQEEFGEAIDSFHIHISRGKYKGNHPFADKSAASAQPPAQPAPLSDEEWERVERACEKVPEGRLRESFRKAMVSDLEWKKGTGQ